jgi:hypothetical protein
VYGFHAPITFSNKKLINQGEKYQTAHDDNEINNNKIYIFKRQTPLDLCFDFLGSKGKYAFSRYLNN